MMEGEGDRSFKFMAEIFSVDALRTKSSDGTETERRIVKALASVEVVDSQGDLVDIDSLLNVMETYRKRGGPLMVEHRAIPVGRMVDYDVVMTPEGKRGLQVTYELFSDYDIDDKVWKGVLDGRLKGLSIAGVMKGRQVCTDRSQCFNHVHQVDLLEVSLVSVPANRKALIMEAREESPAVTRDEPVTVSSPRPVSVMKGESVVASNDYQDQSITVTANNSDALQAVITYKKGDDSLSKEKECDDCPQEEKTAMTVKEGEGGSSESEDVTTKMESPETRSGKNDEVDVGQVFSLIEKMAKTIESLGREIQEIKEKKEEPVKPQEPPVKEEVVVKTVVPKPRSIPLGASAPPGNDDVTGEVELPDWLKKKTGGNPMMQGIPLPSTNFVLPTPKNWDVVKKHLPDYVLDKKKIEEFAVQRRWDLLEACVEKMMLDIFERHAASQRILFGGQ